MQNRHTAPEKLDSSELDLRSWDRDPNCVFAKNRINSLHEPAPHLVFRMFAVLVKSLTRDITPTSTVDWSSVKFASYDAAQAEVGHLPECSCLNDFADAMQDAIALSLQRL